VQLPVAPGSDKVMGLDELVMRPTRIYVKSVLEALATHGNAIHGLAHITGGGLVGNVPRVLPEGLMVRLEGAAWPMPALMQWIQTEGQIDSAEMHRVFNCGIGMVVIVPAAEAEPVAATLTAAGELVFRIGEVQLRSKSEAQTVII